MNAPKIIYASNAYLPSMRANAVHVMRMCDAFADSSLDITLYCDDKGDLEKMYEIYGVRHRFQIVAPKQKRFIGTRKGFLYSLRCGWKNACSISKEKGNICVYGRSLPIIFFLGSRFPFFYEVHATPTNFLFAWMERRVLKRRHLVMLVTISNPLKDYYEDMMPKYLKGKIVVLHDGADTVSCTVKKATIDNKGSRYSNVNIGYVGSLYPGKCMELLLPIAKAMPDVKLHIVGGDDYWVNYWKREATVQKISNLLFYGKVSPVEVSDYYEALDICLMPYSNKIYVDKDRKLEIGQWISPLKLFEAMAHGKAIVVTGLPSIREVMDDGEDALLLDATDTAQWVWAIEKLATSEELRQKLASNSRKKLEQNYSWTMRTKQILSIIESK